MNNPRTSTALTALVLLLALTGCSTYDTRYAFEPRPAEVTLQAPGGVTVAQTLTSIVGVRRAVPAEGVDASVEVRLRIDNVGSRPMRFDTGSLTLVSGDLQQFPLPRVDPPGVLEISPGASIEIVALFPIPNDSSRPRMDLSGLSLRWTVDVDGTTMPASVTVRRRRYSAPPHWLYGWNFSYAWHGHHGHGRYGVHTRCR